MEQMFITATKTKLRFKAPNGQLSVEDLWDLNLNQLDEMAKGLRKETKDSEESFIADKKPDSTVELRFEIVKYVIEVKLEERKTKRLQKERAARREQLKGILATKNAEELRNKSVAELQAELDALED